jgi:hypothetical protein
MKKFGDIYEFVYVKKETGVGILPTTNIALEIVPPLSVAILFIP